ncbi:MAG: protein kinase [Candidatus Limnocylindria bacterium]
MSGPAERTLDTAAGDDGAAAIAGRLLAARYRVIDLVARGGMARIYRAHDERLDRDVALKVLSRPYADDHDYVVRFLSEARTAASISHPNLVHVYDSGSDGDLHYIAMELLPNHRSLRELVATGGPMSPQRAVAIALDVLAGLRAAHARGLVHCDVKSANVMVGESSSKLIDFGIARSRSDVRPEGTSIGSLHYMAPEQLLGESLTPATDLYSVGVMLYEALTGRVPFQGETPDDVAAAHVAGDPAPPTELNPAIGASLDSVVMQALRRDPERRFQTAYAMMDALRSSVSGRSADATPRIRPVPVPAAARPPAVQRPVARQSSITAPPPYRRRRNVPWGAIAIVVAVVGLAGLAWIGVSAVPGLVPGASSEPGRSDPPRASGGPSLGPDEVRVPNVVGLSEDEAIAAATEARLAWTHHWRTDPSAPVGVYAQDLDAGTIVPPGTEFNFYSNRH